MILRPVLEGCLCVLALVIAADPSGTIETNDKDQIKHDKLALCDFRHMHRRVEESWSVTQRMFALNISSLVECTPPGGDHKRSMALIIIFYIF